jgi:hypothetical protein
VPVKSRLLVGVGAWLLGAAAATSGSMIAVNQIAHGLLGPQAQQLTEATISANPDDTAARSGSAAAASSARPSPSAAARSGRPSQSAAARPERDASTTRSTVNVTPSAPATVSPHQTTAGTLLQSPYGSVTAACQPGGAYLLYWSPDQGYQADDVIRGPAALARVIFERPGNEVVMQVSCKSGSPVARLSKDY